VFANLHLRPPSLDSSGKVSTWPESVSLPLALRALCDLCARNATPVQPETAPLTLANRSPKAAPAPLCPKGQTFSLCFHTLTNSFANQETVTPFFSCNYKPFPQNTGGGVSPQFQCPSRCRLSLLLCLNTSISLSPAESTLTDHLRVLPCFGRNRPPATLLESALPRCLSVNSLESASMKQDYLLDKRTASWSNPFMDSKPHFFLDLAAERLAFAIFRMSRLIEASSLRVGTFSKSFFLPSSIGGVL
jgi:hypothetical protein